MSDLRPEFEEALTLFARVSEALEATGIPAPILVGGAAVELYTSSAIATGDFDVVSGQQDAVEAVLRSNGFIKPSGPGSMTRGWIHPELRLGLEIVGSSLLDGMADRHRVKLIRAETGHRFAVIAIEDLIADRMGQYASGAAPDMLQQAQTLFALAGTVDLAYMDRRIREETNQEYGALDVQSRPRSDLP